MSTAKAAPSSGGTVTVGCKLPNGYIMRIFDMVDMAEPIPGAPAKTFKRAVPNEKQYTLRGNRVPFGMMPRYQIIGGYALTPGIPADVWDKWLSQNKDSDLVKNNLIFAHEKVENAAAQAKDQATVRSGLEPINPDKPPVTGIKTADEMKKESFAFADAENT